MTTTTTAEPLAQLEAFTLAALIQEYHAGHDPVVTTATAEMLLPALGRPLTPAQVRDLIVMTWTLGGRNVASLGRFIEAADEYIRHRADRPNLKVRAVAKARAAKAAKREVA